MLETLKKILLIERYKLALRTNTKLYRKLKNLQIMSDAETLRYIINHRCSVSRFGDGEFAVMAGGKNGFQKDDTHLAERLREVINTENTHLLICIPYTLKLNHANMRMDSQLFTYGWLSNDGMKEVYPFARANRQYGDTNCTRFYMWRRNKSNVPQLVSLLKQIWQDRDLCIIEGRYSRLGVGNDLFDNAKSIIRVLGPEKSAFDKYDELLEAGKKYGQSRLVLIAMGMTATVLAYDLSKLGIQAIDIGHVDVEYMWWKMKARKKVPIPSRYVNEAGGNIQADPYTSDETYLKQIALTIL